MGSLQRQALPSRVKSGELTPQGLSVETASARIAITWDRVEFITLGIIEEPVGDAPLQRSTLRNLVRNAFFGDNQNERQRVRKVRDIMLLDVYVRDQPQPYRFDGTTVNYRSFLGEVTHSSNTNFLRLVGRIVHHSIHSRLDSSVVAFLKGQRDRVKHFGGVYDFELENIQNRERLTTQIPRCDLLIDQDSGEVALARDKAKDKLGAEEEENQ